MAIDFNPQLARTLARDNMMTDAAYKSGVMGGDLSTLKKIKDKISQLRQNKGEKMADNKWFPGKFLMQGLGGATGLAQSIPGAVKNITKGAKTKCHAKAIPHTQPIKGLHEATNQ